LLAQEGQRYAQRQALRFDLAEARAADPPDPALVADLEAKLAEAEAAYQEVQEVIAARGAELAALVPGRGQDYILSASQVQELLDGETTVISYFVLEDKTLAFLITRDSFDTIPLEVSQEDLSQKITIFRDFAEKESEHPNSAITLYGWLIEPLKPHLTTSQLAIIPHSDLHYLPFAALTDGQRYLIDDYILTTLPSASALPFIQGNTGRALADPLILGNPTTGDFDATVFLATGCDNLPPLNFAEKEAETIAGLYGVKPLTDTIATESAVRENVAKAGILHLAAHGCFNPIAPLSSLIALAPDQDHDGWLTVGEVYGLDLSSADLVVLSACQTNLGELSAGDELVGLTRAFIFTGTPTVVASLWSVDDFTTTLLMEHFYTHMQAGMGKAEALRQAQVWLRDLIVAELRDNYSELIEGTEYEYLLKLEATERPFANPYYWAGFVLSGDGGEVGDIQPVVTEEVDETATQSSPVTAEETPPPSESGAEEKQNGGGCLGLILPSALVIGAFWRRMRRT
jgi:CHAT domain-containing protein